MEAEELTKEFTRALQQGQRIEQSKKGYASLASMVTMFYEGLHGTGLPEPLVYVLVCNFASQVMETLVLNPAVQALTGPACRLPDGKTGQTGDKEDGGDDRG